MTAYELCYVKYIMNMYIMTLGFMGNAGVSILHFC